MRRFAIAAICVAAVGISGLRCAHLRRLPRPERFVLIIVDSLRADHLGCYGQRRPLTPNLDRLAARSIRFAQCWSAAPWTAESNAGLFTGRYPAAVRTDDGMHLRRDVTTLAELFRAARFATAGFSAHPWIGPEFNFDQGFETFRLGVRQDERAVEGALRWIEKHRKDRYFLLVYLWGPHFPYQPSRIPAALQRRLAPLPPKTRQGAALTSGTRRCPVIVPKATGKADQVSLEEVAALHELYRLCVRDADARVGRVVAALKEDPQAALVVTADHGEEFLDHGGLYHMNSLYQELIDVPLVLCAPGVRARVIEGPVSGLDIMPTLLALARIDAPRGLAGESLLPLPRSPRRTALSEVNTTRSGLHVERYAARAGNHALIYTLSDYPAEGPIPRGGRWELYDLAADPQQKHPLSVQRRDLRLALARRARAARAERLAAKRHRPATQRELAEIDRQLRALGYLAGH